MSSACRRSTGGRITASCTASCLGEVLLDVLQRLHGRPPHAASYRQWLDHPHHAADLVLDPQRQRAAALAGLDLEALDEAGEGHSLALDQAQGGAAVEDERPVLTRP